MASFCLVRHGQTDWNVEGLYQGQSDVPLNSTGRAQAVALASALANQVSETAFGGVFSSDLGRAYETASIIAARLGLVVQVNRELREINLGAWEGRRVEEIQTLYPQAWQWRQEDPVNSRPPGGESLAEVAQRLSAVMDKLAPKADGQDVLIVSHGLAIASVRCLAESRPLAEAYTLIPPNGQPLWLTWPAAEQLNR